VVRSLELKKNLTDEQKEEIAGILDNEGFWYTFSDGGFIKLEDVLENKKDIDKIKDAIKLLQEFQRSLPEL
jgi:RecJ-like exonuclease